MSPEVSYTNLRKEVGHEPHKEDYRRAVGGAEELPEAAGIWRIAERRDREDLEHLVTRPDLDS